jgi:hypothetical protein
MFTNLESEMKKAHISRKDLAVALNLTYTAVSYKMTGITDFKLNEMKTIKKALKTDKSLDYLSMTSAEIGEVIADGCYNEDSKES